MDYIYADFNGIISLKDKDEYEYLELEGYGTIKSLNSLQVRLEEGMKFIFYEPEDIEVVAEVYFDRTTPSIISSEGRWLAKFKKGTIRDCNKVENWDEPHPCFNCREDLKPYLKKVGQNYKEKCPKCGTSVCFPLFEP
jgi:hypothetical protein